MQWVIPRSDTEISAWLKQFDEDTLDAFIKQIEYVLGGEGHGHLVVATILGAARAWRDDGVEPLVTFEKTAPPGFYEPQRGVANE
jgi:hypothetical protein